VNAGQANAGGRVRVRARRAIQVDVRTQADGGVVHDRGRTLVCLPQRGCPDGAFDGAAHAIETLVRVSHVDPPGQVAPSSRDLRLDEDGGRLQALANELSARQRAVAAADVVGWQPRVPGARLWREGVPGVHEEVAGAIGRAAGGDDALEGRKV